jgi:hypothetical protein
MVLLICRSILIIVEIHHLSPSIITLQSVKTSQCSLHDITDMETHKLGKLT